jgi:DnaK suppressor protein
MGKLTDEKLRRLQNLLHEREQVLRSDITREVGIKDDYADVASPIPDSGDASFADLSVDLGNASVARDLAELRAIEAARIRMEQDTYGECIDCGFDIPYERLEAQPTADRCAPCQEAYEKTHVDAMRGGTM